MRFSGTGVMCDGRIISTRVSYRFEGCNVTVEVEVEVERGL